MKKRNKKHLLSYLSLILGGFSIAAIAASCAAPSSSASTNTNSQSGDTNTNSQVSQQPNNPNNPSSPNSISTIPGQPLQESQIEYHTKLANSIQSKVDNYSRLNYKNKNDSSKINQLLKTYREKISSGPLGNLIQKINSTDFKKTNINDLLELFYNGFKQKNLLPTTEEITKSNPTHIPNLILGSLAAFYSDPENVIFINQFVFLKGSNWIRNSDAIFMNKDFFLSWYLYDYLRTFLYSDGSNQVFTNNFLSYQVFKVYHPILIKLYNLYETIS